MKRSGINRCAGCIALWLSMASAAAEDGEHPCATRVDDVPERTVLDAGYDRLSRGLCWPSRWVDNFFENPEDIPSTSASSQMRAVYEQRWQNDDTDGNNVRVRGRVHLPNAQSSARRSVSLILSNDDDITEGSEELTRDPSQVGGGPENEESTFTGAVRFAQSVWDTVDISTDVGISSDLKGFVRARYQYATPLPGEQWWFRFSEKGYWEDPDGFGAQTNVDFDRPLSDNTTLRFINEAELTEEQNELKLGWRWFQSASIFHVLGKRSAIAWQLGWEGFTKPVTRFEVVRTNLRFRRSIWKPWLYYEVEPYAFWARNDGFDTKLGIVARVEVQLGRYD